jgi:hypothetical protein
VVFIANGGKTIAATNSFSGSALSSCAVGPPRQQHDNQKRQGADNSFESQFFVYTALQRIIGPADSFHL